MESVMRPGPPSASSSGSAQHQSVQRSPRTTWTHVQGQHGAGSGSFSPQIRGSSCPRSPADHPAHVDRLVYNDVEPPMLIPSSPHRRTPRLHAQPPQPSRAFSPPLSAIPFPTQNQFHPNNSQHVRPHLLNGFPPNLSTDPSTGYIGLPSSSQLESHQLSSSSSPRHGTINSPAPRLRTFNQVFHTTSDLAAHHGIPQSFPPPPRTTPRRLSDPEPSDSASEFNFATLCSNYITMLSPQNATQSASTTDQQSTSGAPMSSTQDEQARNEAAAQAIMAALSASSDFSASNVFDMSDYLTSPLESPLDDDMLTTPALGSADMMSGPDIFTSPALMDMGGDFGDMPSLFGDLPGYDAYESKPAPRRQPTASQLLTPNFDDLYTMSPGTPALDPTSLSSPRGRSTSSARRKSAPTGTRKNVTPDSLVPMDAPIQPRKYLTPSQTSRKELPATFARKRARSQAFGDDDEQDAGAEQPTLSEEDAIKAKRLQNTLAARRSRKRKLEYQRELEDALEDERKEKEMWKARSLVLEALLRDKGHDVPRMDGS